jgi:hypothetical protein
VILGVIWVYVGEKKEDGDDSTETFWRVRFIASQEQDERESEKLRSRGARYVLDEWGYLHFADWLVTYKISTINLTSIRYCPKIFTLI